MNRLKFVGLVLALATASAAVAQETVPVALERGQGALIANIREQTLTGSATVDYLLPVESGDMVTVTLVGNFVRFEVHPPDGGEPIASVGMIPSVDFTASVTGDFRVRAFLPEPHAEGVTAYPYSIGFIVRRRP